MVTERYKLVHFYEPMVDYWELFDRQRDPLELTSVYNQPDYASQQAELHQELARLRKELKVPAADPAASFSNPQPKKK
jgi:arylsulfatase A-like enzyme